MNQFQRASAILGIEPGANKESLHRRYKYLVMVWHPDRFPTEEGKKYAEEELKKINNAKDLLWKHFEKGEHKGSACVCQGNVANTPPPPPRPEPKPQPHAEPGTKGKSGTEQKAEQRDAERRARAAQEADEKKKGKERQGVEFNAAMAQQSEFEAEKLRWRIAVAEGLIFISLCLYGWIGTGVVASTRSNGSSGSTQSNSLVEERKDPCSLAGTYSVLPERIASGVLDAAKSKASVWTIRSDGTSGGGIVEGRDSANRLVLVQVIAPDWSIEHQDFIEANTGSNEITVSRYRQPADYVGRSIYRYDSSNHFLEAVKQDSQNNTELTATVERTKFGKFYSLDVQREGGNTTRYYDISGTDIKSQFYMGSLCMKIDMFVEAAGTLTGPGAATLTDASTKTFLGSSATPHLDELLRENK